MAPPSLSRAKSLHRTPANRETIIPFTEISLSLVNTYAKIPRKAARLCGGFLALLVALRLTIHDIGDRHRSIAARKTYQKTVFTGRRQTAKRTGRRGADPYKKNKRYIVDGRAAKKDIRVALDTDPHPCLLLPEKGDRGAVDEE